MRGTLIPLVGAIAAAGFLSDFTPSSDVAPDDVYAWRWTIDTILDAQKKASRRDATLPTTAPRSFVDRGAVRDLSPFPFGGT